MNFRRQTICLALASLLVLGACSSSPPPGRGGPRTSAFANLPSVYAAPFSFLYVGMDWNSDGMTARDEVERWSATAFPLADRDQDGGLRPIEFAAFTRVYLGTDTEAVATDNFDRDLNGRIEPREFEGYLLYRFEQLDENGDGTLQRSELLTRVEPPAEARERQGRGGQAGGRGGRGGGGRRR